MTETRWKAKLPDDARRVTLAGDAIYVRAGQWIVALDRRGKETWRADLGDGAGRGSFVLVAGDTIITDTTRGPKQTAELVAVRGGSIAWQTALRMQVADDGACVSGDALWAIGPQLPKGLGIRSIALADGDVRIEREVPRGRDVFAWGTGIVVLSSTTGPGLEVLGGDVIEAQPVQQAAIAGGQLLAAVRSGDGEGRSIVMRDAKGRARWTARGTTPLVALDAELALHAERDGAALVPVARDAASGDERWRGTALPRESGAFVFAGPVIAFRYGIGTAIYRRTDGALVADLPVTWAHAGAADAIYCATATSELVCLDPAAIASR